MPFGGLLSAGIGAGGSILSGLLGSSAARTAAKQQRAAALQAQGVADQNSQKARDANDQNTQTGLGAITNTRGMVNDNTTNANNLFSPYTQVGQTAAGGLNSALQNPFQFNMQDDPGYQFRLQQGQKAIEQSAAARGGAASGGALKALTQYGQGFASNEYQNAFGRHQQQLQNLFQGAGLGLSASNTMSGNLNQNSALNSGLTGDELGTLQNNSLLNSNILGQNSQLASSNYTGAGNAQAAGTVGSANAIGGAINGLGQTANQLFLYNLLKSNPGGTGATPPYLGGTSNVPLPGI